MKGDWYAAYPKYYTADEMTDLFRLKRGYAPAEIVDAGAIWLVGPIREKESNAKAKLV